ncbi:MAG: hypothetical protein HWN66_09985 [Candidatus Helarchaeota archaeon]|nr:hypothetical protein [Candidatus Helarchaeota archaeon]
MPTKRQKGGILVLMGGLPLFYAGISQLIWFFNWLPDWSLPTDLLEIISFMGPFAFPILGVLVVVAGINLLFKKSSGEVLALIGGIAASIWVIIYGISNLISYILSPFPPPIQYIRYNLLYFIILNILLQDCPLIIGAILSYRSRSTFENTESKI